MPTLPQSQNSYTYALNNPVRFTDPSGRFPLLFLAMIAVGTPIIAGVTTAAWDLFVSQGVGLGGHNQFRFGCADWSRVANAGRLAAAGATNSLLSIPLGPLYLMEQLIFGKSPDETNLMVAGWFGLDNEYQALLSNPHFQAGQWGGHVGSMAISLFMLSHGITQFTSTAAELIAQTSTGAQMIVAVVESAGELNLLFGGVGTYVSIIAMSSNNGPGSNNQYRKLQDAEREVNRWGKIDDNLERANERHLRLVREERRAGRPITEGHQRELNSARHGLINVVKRIDNMLHPYHTWELDAVRYLQQIRTDALNAIALMDDALFGPLP